MSSEETTILGIFGLIALLLIYFVPSFNAHGRNHANLGAIICLNVLLGWTFIGWVIALVWSFTNNIKQPGPYDHMTPGGRWLAGKDPNAPDMTYVQALGNLASGAARPPLPGSPFAPAPGSGINA